MKNKKRKQIIREYRVKRDLKSLGNQFNIEDKRETRQFLAEIYRENNQRSLLKTLLRKKS